MVTALQPSLFGLREPSFDPTARPPIRTELAHGAWYDHVPGWLTGDLDLFETLARSVAWRAERRPMYDRVVDVPRLTASLPRDGEVPPVLAAVRRWLGATYGAPFTKVGLAWYRDGRDSVAPHGDQVARDLDTTVMATLSLASPRRFTMRCIERDCDSRSLELGNGDLLVLGGTIQRTWEHGVPKTARTVGPRMAVMFRPRWLG